ncbi:MAG: nuclear transport factor 2 family protein [Kineosporiaceae bacterium]
MTTQSIAGTAGGTAPAPRRPAGDLREVYETHMRYIAEQDIDGLVHDTYTDDAVLVHNFPYFDGPGPYRHVGKDAIIAAQKTIFAPANHGAIVAGPTFEFLADGDTIVFQLHILSPTRGRWMNTDLWTVRDGKLAEQYVLGYPLDDVDRAWAESRPC